MKIHTCTREVDVTVDAELEELLLAEHEDPKAGDFEPWIHFQLLGAKEYNAI
jgi:hypothetical protein